LARLLQFKKSVVCITDASGALPNGTWKAVCPERDQVQAPWINTDIPST
jgi:hypothetical protein